MLKSWIFKVCASKIYFNIITENYIHSHFCWQRFHQNRTRIDFGIMFWKNVVLYEIYSKNLQWPNTFYTSLYIYQGSKLALVSRKIGIHISYIALLCASRVSLISTSFLQQAKFSLLYKSCFQALYMLS